MIVYSKIYDLKAVIEKKEVDICEEFNYDKVLPEKKKANLDFIFRCHPEKVPIILQQSYKSNIKIPNGFKKKYLVPPNFSFDEFLCCVANKLSLKNCIFYIGFKGFVLNFSEKIVNIYNKFKDDDMHLKILFSDNNDFMQNIQLQESQESKINKKQSLYNIYKINFHKKIYNNELYNCIRCETETEMLYPICDICIKCE